MSASPLTCTLDLDAPGKQFGVLQLPRSSNQSGWSTLWIPIVSVASGEGPTALVLGGVHGDEPEGQVAALNLARELQPEQVTGRVIVIPCLSPEASRAYSRLWPSGANLNRSFPGSPTGPPDEQLAHYLSTELFPLADVVVDIHSGGRTGLCLPWSEMHWVEDADAATRDDRRDARVERRLVLRLHRHRRHRPARRRGGAAGEDRRLHRARRRRSRHRRDPPAGAERARERAAALRRPGRARSRRASRSGCRRRRS